MGLGGGNWIAPIGSCLLDRGGWIRMAMAWSCHGQEVVVLVCRAIGILWSRVNVGSLQQSDGVRRSPHAHAREQGAVDCGFCQISLSGHSMTQRKFVMPECAPSLISPKLGNCKTNGGRASQTNTNT